MPKIFCIDGHSKHQCKKNLALTYGPRCAFQKSTRARARLGDSAEHPFRVSPGGGFRQQVPELAG